MGPILAQTRQLVASALEGGMVVYLSPRRAGDGATEHEPVRAWLRVSRDLRSLQWTQTLEQPGGRGAAPAGEARHWRVALEDVVLASVGRETVTRGVRRLARQSGDSPALASCLFGLAVTTFALPVEFLAQSPEQRAELVAALALVCSILPS